MADDTNIDDILKSIDALLREGEAEDVRGQKDKRPRHEAINDDEVGADTEGSPDEMSAEEAGEDLPASQDEQRLDDQQLEEQQLDEQQLDDQHLVEHQFDEQHRDELQQEADAADMDDHPVNLPAEEDAGEKDVPPEAQPAARRIVLSEDMLVADTPDLPLAFAEDDEQADDDEQAEGYDQAGDADETEITAGEDVGEEDVVGENVAEEDDAGQQTQARHAPPGDALDTGRLIAQISAEISTRLQEALPGLVAEAVRRHLAAQAGASGIEAGDSADADGD